MWISFWRWEGFDPISGKSFSLYGKNEAGYEVGAVEIADAPESLPRAFGVWSVETPIEASEPPLGALAAVGAVFLVGGRRRAA
jgi:hypothetical protein